MSVTTLRDIDMLGVLYDYHFMTIEQAAQCVYPNRNVAQRRLSNAEKNGLVQSFPLLAGTRGQPTKVYYLNGHRKLELEELLTRELDVSNLHRKAPENLSVTRHLIELNTTIVSFFAGARRVGYGFECIPEYRATHADFVGHGLLEDEVPDPDHPLNTIRYRRDAALCFSSSQRKALYELEYDRGTEVLRSTGPRSVTLEKKIKTFLAALRSRSFERFARPELFNYEFKACRLLLVTNNAIRLQHLAELCDELGTHGLVYLTTLDQLTPNHALGRIWQVPPCGPDELKPLLGSAA